MNIATILFLVFDVGLVAGLIGSFLELWNLCWIGVIVAVTVDVIPAMVAGARLAIEDDEWLGGLMVAPFVMCCIPFFAIMSPVVWVRSKFAPPLWS